MLFVKLLMESLLTKSNFLIISIEIIINGLERNYISLIASPPQKIYLYPNYILHL